MSSPEHSQVSGSQRAKSTQVLGIVLGAAFIVHLNQTLSHTEQEAGEATEADRHQHRAQGDVTALSG